MKRTISERTIGRLSLYRRLLSELGAEGARNVYSHQLAGRAGCTAAQVRRDLMAIGYTGSPYHGYNVEELAKSIGRFLDHTLEQPVVLVGVGNLGRAILTFYADRHPKLPIAACFDRAPEKVGRLVNGCRCHPVEEMESVVRRLGSHVGILAVPSAAAQDVADRLIQAGVRGILNFAPVRLRVPIDVYVEDLDMTMALEKVAYFARPALPVETAEAQR
ncbi:MAG: redox-sensing transcriptional repressor Rex [Acidobacteria bacterium]|nr:redox-sensing transcriptional repressor Rex [Acidobacteriota bacterium]